MKLLSGWRRLGAAVLLSLSVAAVAQEKAAPPVFPHPDRIRFDGQCFTIDGQDQFIFSAAFHYFRCPKDLWRDRFQKIKAAGCNTVETYVAWNWHEPEPPAGLADYSKMNLADLEAWITMAEETGLYVIIRPGPYLCAEWKGGGYPLWLKTLMPADWPQDRMWLRGAEPTYLAWCKHWYDAVCPIIARHQISNQEKGKPGIILMQIENEYDYAPQSRADKMTQLRELARFARASGVEIPIFTCVTSDLRGDRKDEPLLKDVVETNNVYCGFGVDGLRGSTEELRAAQPGAPLMVTELQGGWFTRWDGNMYMNPHEMTGAQIQNLTLFAVQLGYASLNCYMFFGGTNFGDWGARWMNTSYDYAAPLREHGGTWDRYDRMADIGAMLKDHGARLVRSQPVEVATTQNVHRDVQVALRQAADGSRYVFVRSTSRQEHRSSPVSILAKDGFKLTFTYDLGPFDAKILWIPAGPRPVVQWLPKPAYRVKRPAPADLPPATIPVQAIATRADPLPQAWKPVAPGQMLEAVGVTHAYPIYYRASFGKLDKPMQLGVRLRRGDAVIAQDLQAAAASAAAGPAPASVIPFDTKIENGEVFLPVAASREALVLLYENAGISHGDKAMEQGYGFGGLRLLPADALVDQPVTGWLMDGKPVKTTAADQFRDARTASFSATLTLPGAAVAPDAQVTLTLACVDDAGIVLVNGQVVAEVDDWSKPQVISLAGKVKAGDNALEVRVKNGSGQGGLGPVTWSLLPKEAQPAPLRLEFADGVRERGLAWSKPELDEVGWNPVKIGESADGLLVWYRVKFELPERKPGVWIPWSCRINPRGNGFIWLNGQPLGRCREKGAIPQWWQGDFYLPECWLNFGPGKANVLTFCLRPCGKGTGLDAIEIVSLPEYAEKR
jgi:hypothetical protein